MSEIGLYNVLWYVAIYSVLGWCGEVIYHTVVCGNFENRGFLNGPVCPIYGFGAASIIVILKPVSGNMIVLFICSMILTTFLEFITGFVLEKLFGTRWWDYSDVPFNIMGYVCLKFSILWGAAGVFVVRVIHPLTDKFISYIPDVIGIICICIFYAVFIFDTVMTVISVNKLNKRLKRMTEAAANLRNMSDKMGTYIHGRVVSTMEKEADTRYALSRDMEDRKREIIEYQLAAAIKIGSSKAQLEKKRAEIEADIEERFNKLEILLNDNTRIQKRLLKTFSGAKSKKYNDMLERIKENIRRNSKK